MKKNTLINWTLSILVALVIFTILVFLLLGENGLINKKIQEYKDAHTEELQDNKDENTIVVK